MGGCFSFLRENKMAYEEKTFKINDKDYLVTIKHLKVRDKFKGQGYISEIVLPIMGGMIDEKAKDADEIFYDVKSTMYKDLFTHLATKLSEDRLWDMFENMLVGATYKCPASGQVLPLNLEEFCEHKDGAVTMNELLMFCVEANFSSLFTDNGILQSLAGKTVDLITTG